MIALDTNVLVRFLVRDDESQYERAARLMQQAQRNDEAVFVADVVLCELVWVLQRAYKIPKADIVATLGDLLRARHMEFDDSGRIERALDAFAHGRGDFADYLIREQAFGAGCDAVATFDQAIVRDKGFTRA